MQSNIRRNLDEEAARKRRPTNQITPDHTGRMRRNQSDQGRCKVDQFVMKFETLYEFIWMTYGAEYPDNLFL